MDVEGEVKTLVEEVKRLGTVNAEGKISVKFGVLFKDDRCANIFEALVGTLRCSPIDILLTTVSPTTPLLRKLGQNISMATPQRYREKRETSVELLLSTAQGRNLLPLLSLSCQTPALQHPSATKRAIKRESKCGITVT